MSNISASSTCGSYTQLDQYEFTYDIVLFESIGRIVSSYRYFLFFVKLEK